MHSWERFGETSLPDKKSFYSKLYLEEITDKYYTHTQKVFEELKLNNLDDYHDLYVLSDTLLLADVFDPTHFFVCTWISMSNLFKNN